MKLIKIDVHCELHFQIMCAQADTVKWRYKQRTSIITNPKEIETKPKPNAHNLIPGKNNIASMFYSYLLSVASKRISHFIRFCLNFCLILYEIYCW